MQLSRLLGREVADSRTSGIIYVAVVQAILLYGLETWLMTSRILKFLGGFHHRVAHRMMGGQHQRGRYGGWVYPPMAESMSEAGLQEVET